LPRKVCVVTGTRADYGLLYWVMRAIADEAALELQLVATGMHLSPAFGFTVTEIERDGFSIDARVEMLLASDSGVGTAKSLGLGVIGFADALDRLRPDILLLLGDRFEILAAAETAMLLNIPIAHIAGGDTTEGAFDEAIRHAVTKMAHLHFVTNETAARRVRQLGENPEHVYTVGSPGIDAIKRMELLDREALHADLDLPLRAHNLLITFHPVTLDQGGERIEELLGALHDLGGDFGLIFTKPNADPGSAPIGEAIDAFLSTHDNARSYTSLGQRRYLSLMSLVDAVVGNSSSGLAEAPSFGTPSVNIGARQRGRLMAVSVVQCDCERAAIREAIERAVAMGHMDVVNPYGDGQSAARIVEVLKTMPEPASLLQKRFFTVEASA
jgi:UDP-hydrolysing UDP-N-acetyl-D-glucosamine 2-epimerase